MSASSLFGWVERWLQRGRERRYWRRRVRRHGAAAVINIGHGADALERITRHQKELLLPLLRAELKGNERVLLDFGCGAGRFTPDLARLVNGTAIGVDPVADLLVLAPAAPGVRYHRFDPPRLPIASESVDVVWILCVLCNITDPTAVREAAAEVDRVLKRGGLLFLVENTAEKPAAPHVRYRPTEEYRGLFPGIALREVQEHEDLGERISVLAGRKRAGQG